MHTTSVRLECLLALVAAFGCGDDASGGGDEPVCGNSEVEAGEQCDDGDSCTVHTVAGAACQATCESTAIERFVDGDGCCPALEGASAFVDFDCARVLR